MKLLGIASFTVRGARTAEAVAAAFADEYEIVRYVNGNGLKSWCGQLFAAGADGIIFVGACGIAVRTIAPFLKSKTTDPAVLVIDEAGQFVISLLSGHIGGANRLTNRAAALLGATPVITTATDVNGKFAVDVFARDNHLRMSSMGAAREISAAILRGERVGVVCEGKMEGELPPELVSIEPGMTPSVQLAAVIQIGAARRDFTFSLNGEDLDAAGTEPAIWVSQLPPVILGLYPKSYVLGIGCRKGKTAAEISLAVNQVLSGLGISMREIVGAASVDLKKGEPGLLEFCEKNDLQFATWPAETLAAVEGEFSRSSFVHSVTGVDNVCERAAICMARELSAHGGQEGGSGAQLVLGKQAEGGVTVALAERTWKVRF